MHVIEKRGSGKYPLMVVSCFPWITLLLTNLTAMAMNLKKQESVADMGTRVRAALTLHGTSDLIWPTTV